MPHLIDKFGLLHQLDHDLEVNSEDGPVVASRDNHLVVEGSHPVVEGSHSVEVDNLLVEVGNQVLPVEDTLDFVVVDILVEVDMAVLLQILLEVDKASFALVGIDLHPEGDKEHRLVVDRVLHLHLVVDMELHPEGDMVNC